MAGADFRVEVAGRSAIEGRLKGLLDKFGDLTPLMQVIGQLGETDTQDNFAGEHAPDGTPWIPSVRVREHGGKTLQPAHPRLSKSISWRATARSAEWGSNVVYAGRHQNGFSGTEQVRSHKRTMRVVFGVQLLSPVEVTVGAFTRKANTPARPFLGLSATLREDIEDQFDHYVGGAA